MSRICAWQFKLETLSTAPRRPAAGSFQRVCVHHWYLLRFPAPQTRPCPAVPQNRSSPGGLVPEPPESKLLSGQVLSPPQRGSVPEQHGRAEGDARAACNPSCNSQQDPENLCLLKYAELLSFLPYTQMLAASSISGNSC